MYVVVKTETLSLPGIIYDTLYSTLRRGSNINFFKERSFKYISHHTSNKLYLMCNVILLWSVYTKDLFHQISTKHNSWTKFEVLTVKTMTITVFCDVPTSNVVDGYHHFRATCCRILLTLSLLHWWWRQTVSLEQWYLSTNYIVLYHKRKKSLSQMSS